jgi:hypothetical protein
VRRNSRTVLEAPESEVRAIRHSRRSRPKDPPVRTPHRTNLIRSSSKRMSDVRLYRLTPSHRGGSVRARDWRPTPSGIAGHSIFRRAIIDIILPKQHVQSMGNRAAITSSQQAEPPAPTMRQRVVRLPSKCWRLARTALVCYVIVAVFGAPYLIVRLVSPDAPASTAVIWGICTAEPIASRLSGNASSGSKPSVSNSPWPKPSSESTGRSTLRSQHQSSKTRCSALFRYSQPGGPSRAFARPRRSPPGGPTRKPASARTRLAVS